MLFRSRKSSSGAVSPRQSTALAATATASSLVPSPSAGYERPSSAPVAGAVPIQGSSSAPAFTSPKQDDAQNVEDRLNIVKRSRTASTAKPFTTTRESGSGGGASALRSPDAAAASTPRPSPRTTDANGQLFRASGGASSFGVAPPCSSYPTFSLAKLPKHEQHVMDALMREFTEVLFFPKDDVPESKTKT